LTWPLLQVPARDSQSPSELSRIDLLWTGRVWPFVLVRECPQSRGLSQRRDPRSLNRTSYGDNRPIPACRRALSAANYLSPLVRRNRSRFSASGNSRYGNHGKPAALASRRESKTMRANVHTAHTAIKPTIIGIQNRIPSFATPKRPGDLEPATK